MTVYVILDQVEGGSWRHTGTVQARSASSAVRALLDEREHDERAGSFVAVPVRSWKPVTVSVETKTTLKFS